MTDETARIRANFAAWIDHERSEQAMTQAALASHLGVSAQFMTDVKAGRRALTRGHWPLLAIILNESLDTVYARAGEIPPDVVFAMQADPSIEWAYRKFLRTVRRASS